MPTYEYRCDACGHQFEEIQKISEPALTKCPVCGEDKVRRLIAATAFHLKGGGWYKTDYASSSSSSGSSSSTSSSSSSSSPSSNDSTPAKPASEPAAAPAPSASGSDSSSGSSGKN